MCGQDELVHGVNHTRKTGWLESLDRRRGRKGRRGKRTGRISTGRRWNGWRHDLPELYLPAAKQPHSSDSGCGARRVAGTVNGEVTRVDIAQRSDVGTSGYEKIVGTIHFAIDPGHPRNG